MKQRQVLTKHLLTLLFFLIIGSVHAQLYMPIASWYEWDRARFKTQFRIPKDTLATADSGSIAIKNGILYLKAGNWQHVGKVDTNLLLTKNRFYSVLDSFKAKVPNLANTNLTQTAPTRNYNVNGGVLNIQNGDDMGFYTRTYNGKYSHMYASTNALSINYSRNDGTDHTQSEIFMQGWDANWSNWNWTTGNYTKLQLWPDSLSLWATSGVISLPFLNSAGSGTYKAIVRNEADGRLATQTLYTGAYAVHVVTNAGSDYTATEAGYYELPNLTPEGANRAFTLPDAAANVGKTVMVRNTSDSWEFVWTLTEPIYGPDNFPRMQLDAQTVYILLSNGTAWVILSAI